MQTFLPYKGYIDSASALDRQRLGKQRVEVLQLLEILDGKDSPWKHSPVVKMWKGYEHNLAHYGCILCSVWLGKGYKDTCFEKINEYRKKFKNTGIPPWLGDEKLHLSHRSNLIRKNPEHYKPIFGNDVPDNLPYYWPERKLAE
jgi:hypothetical protein